MCKNGRDGRSPTEGTRIRITSNGKESAKYFSVGDVGTILFRDWEGDYKVQFDSGHRAYVSNGGDEKMKVDNACYAEFEVIDGQ